MKRIFREFYRNFLASLCILLTVVSCAGNKKEDSKDVIFGNKDYADSFVSQLKPGWFKTPKRFQLLDGNKNPVVHRFFDIHPFRSIENKTINTIIVTPAKSKYLNEIDLSSGQIFTHRKFCSQSDEYKKYNSSINRPNFSIGILPRVLDQLNQPQRVIVFGSEKYINQHYKTHYFDARVVGGYIEQLCPYGGCFKAEQWLSRLVLVAIQNDNKKYKNINSITELQKVFDWEYAKAFIQNGEGKNIIAEKYFPRKRLGALVSAKQAVAFLDKNSTIFTKKKLNEMRTSCYKLYDYLWKDLSYINTGAKKANSNEEIRQKAIELRNKKIKGKRDLSFSRRFTRNFKKFHEQYKTCSKFIYPTNINDDITRHWFFAHITAFHHLHDLGYAYSCSNKSWNVNPVVSKGRRLKSIQEQFRDCSDSDLDRAFTYAPTVLDNLRRKNRLSYRYIDYDKGSTGSHLKIYNWVKISPAAMECSAEKDREFNFDKEIFPKDIRWKNRGQNNKSKTRKERIIY